MLLKCLTLENFGLFRGVNAIPLAPHTVEGKVRPVVLIGGKNGAGKTTLLEAIRLCLYGPLAVGQRVGSRHYEQYLGGRMHRTDTFRLQSNASSVALDFDYAECSQRHSYHVKRSWHSAGDGVDCRLTILRDGMPLDELDQAHADDFLRDLIPPGVSQLYFFDGEKIQELAETGEDDVVLAAAIRGLLGLDLTERLQSDLRIYASRLDDSASSEPIAAKLGELELQREGFKAENIAALRCLDEAKSRRDRLRQDCAVAEQRLAREGGAFATQFESLKAERTSLHETIEGAENEIRELCEDLLPFALAPRLCRVLRSHLAGEEKLQAWQAQERLLGTRIKKLKKGMAKALFPSGMQINAKLRNELTDRVVQMLQSLAERPDDIADVPLIHRFSEDQYHRLLGAIDRLQNDMPKQLAAVQLRLEKATRRLQDVESSLAKVPTEDQLQPILDRLKELHRDLADAAGEVERREAELRGIDLKLVDIDRQLNKLRLEHGRVEKAISRQTMVARVSSVLEDYSHALTSAKAKELSAAVAARFLQLWRKGDVVRRIEIDPNTFQVRLFDRHERIVPKQELSAGEKQVYAISLLWGLAQVTGRPLPMVIDTPLGRLDSDHRSHLVERYFPHASHQVIILSTDTEIDQGYFRDLDAQVSHAFHLQYDAAEGRTVVEQGYFWSRGAKELARAN